MFADLVSGTDDNLTATAASKTLLPLTHRSAHSPASRATSDPTPGPPPQPKGAGEGAWPIAIRAATVAARLPLSPAAAH
jgi:hypothetical protein